MPESQKNQAWNIKIERTTNKRTDYKITSTKNTEAFADVYTLSAHPSILFVDMIGNYANYVSGGERSVSLGEDTPHPLMRGELVSLLETVIGFMKEHGHVCVYTDFLKVGYIFI